MSFIDTTYFTKATGLYIPGVQTTANANLSQFTPFLEAKEKEMLIKGLGFALYTEFITELAGAPAAKWTELRDGKTYTKNVKGVDMSVRWRGFANTDLKSPIANYTYWHWVRENVNDNSLVGIVQNANENSTNQSAHKKMVDAWRGFYKMYEDCTEYNTEVSLYQFITDMNDETADTYPNWVFTKLGNQNTLGI